MQVGDLVKLKPGAAFGSNFGERVGLVIEHDSGEDRYYKIMWTGPWYTWEEVCNLEVISASR